MRYSYLCIFLSVCISSCETTSNNGIECADAVKRAYKYAVQGAVDVKYYDSVLQVVDKNFKCDSARRNLTDFKIRAFFSLGRYGDAIGFIDSLNENDFTYPYKKFVTAKTARSYLLKSKDSLAAREELSKAVDSLKYYMNSHKLTESEFREAVSDYFSLESQLVDTGKINRELDSLKRLYPERSVFFNFFRQTG